MTTVWDINLFYPLLALVLIVLTVTICSVIKSRNGNMTFRDIFCKSSDNAKDVTIYTTSKMKDMHDNVVHVQFGEEHEKEFDVIEKELKKLQNNINELNEKVDLLIKRLVILETRK